MKESIQSIKAQLDKANVDHGVALKQYENLMMEIKEQHGFSTLQELEAFITQTRSEIPEDEDKRDAMLAKAACILQNTGVEGSNGTIKQPITQRREPPRPKPANTMAQNRVRGRVPATNQKRRID